MAHLRGGQRESQSGSISTSDGFETLRVFVFFLLIGTPLRLAGGAKDVTDIVRGMVVDSELHVNPNAAPQYMNRTFWPETASGPPIPRKLAGLHVYPHDTSTLNFRLDRGNHVLFFIGGRTITQTSQGGFIVV